MQRLLLRYKLLLKRIYEILSIASLLLYGKPVEVPDVDAWHLCLGEGKAMSIVAKIVTMPRAEWEVGRSPMRLKRDRTTMKMYNEGKVRIPISRNAPTQELDRGNCLMIRIRPSLYHRHDRIKQPIVCHYHRLKVQQTNHCSQSKARSRLSFMNKLVLQFYQVV